MALNPVETKFIACEADPGTAEVVVYGIPFEGRVNQRHGADRGPAEIRRASDLIETYSPRLGADLADLRLADAGDVPLAGGKPEAVLAGVAAELRGALDPRQRWVFLGGDHTVAAPVVQAVLGHHPALRVVQFDAHPDLRSQWLGERWNYASAMTRVLDHLAPERLYQIGIRTGDREEWVPPRGTRVFPAWAGPARDAARVIGPELAGQPVHVTVDIDVLDPAIAPGTGAPEPGGIDVPDLVGAFQALARAGARVVGFDLVEVSPEWDPSGRTGVTAAAVIREAILTFWGRPHPVGGPARP